MLSGIPSVLPSVRAVDILDIVVVSFIIYWILVFIRGTRAVQILSGLLLVMAMFVLSKRLGMVTFQWIVGNFLGYLIVILVVIFQSEIRRGLAKMGQARIFGLTPAGAAPGFLEEMARSAFSLSATRTGGIILIEKRMRLDEHIEHGRRLDAVFSQDLLLSILSTASPIHDGAVVIRDGRVAAAAVLLPLPADSLITRGMGTRHRAAWGIAVETDAVTVVISEETGGVTVFEGSRMRAAGSEAELRDILRTMLAAEEEPDAVKVP